MAHLHGWSLHPLFALALLCLLYLPAHADDTTTEEPTSTSAGDLPELPSETSTSEVPTVPAQIGGGNRGVQAYQEQQSFTSSLEAALSSVAATMTAAAPWATSTTGMAPYTDEEDTVVLHSEGSLTYACPNDGDEWVVEDLTDSLSAHTATGAGCYVQYAFKGDGVQIYGATGTDGGVFGCSVSAGSRNYTGWWNGYGTSNTYKPYQGSCAMQGLGWDEHTIQLVNSPYQPGKVWFTGLRYSTNKTEQPWETHSWDACCAGYTFPDGVATTVESKPKTTGAASGTSVAGMSTGTMLMVVCGLGLVIALASVLIGCMCCKKRPASGNAGTKSALRDALNSDSSDSESQPLRGKNRSLGRRKRHGGGEKDDDETGSSSSSGSSGGSEDEKHGRRHRKRR
ncbi:hypothetical protein JCM10450v2_005664 [Rhodotorula kratochvilovae]